MPETAAADEIETVETNGVLLTLQAQPVVEAIATLDTLGAGEGVQELRDLLSEWRAVESVEESKYRNLRKVAAQFHISLSNTMRNQTESVIDGIAKVHS